MEIGAVKGISLVVLLVLQLVCAFLPVLIVRCALRNIQNTSKFKLYVSLLNCFAGGVFFATSMLNLLPEAQEQVDRAMELIGMHTSYPVTEFLLAVGFFLVLIIEHTVGVCQGRGGHGHSHGFPAPAPAHSESSVSNQESTSFAPDTVDQNEPRMTGIKRDSQDNLVQSEHTTTDRTLEPNILSISYKTFNGIDATTGMPAVTANIKNGTRLGHTYNNVIITPEDPKHREELAHGHAHNDTNSVDIANPDDKKARPQLAKLRSMILLIALSLHMIFDGLALGLQKKESKVWQLLAALCVHKAVISFSVGLRLQETLSSLKQVVVYIVLFALVSPIGIGIGLAVTTSDNMMAQDVASAVLQSIAAGTFLYVTFFEILQKELCHSHKLINVLFTLVGFVVVAGLRFIGEGEE
jgi:zinc transporter 1/2/3